MNTEPGMVPWSYSSCSRTSRNVRLPEAGLGLLGCDLADALLGLAQQVAVTRHLCSLLVEPCKCYRRGRVFPTWPRIGVRSASTRTGRTSPSRSRSTNVGDAVERRRLGVEDHQDGAGPQRVLGERRPPGRRRATCRPRGRRRRRRPRAAPASRSAGTRFSPNEIVADFRIPPQSRHAGSSSPARTRSSGLLHRAAPAALEALRLVHVAVDLDDDLRRGARGLVQPVDVLRDQRVEAGASLELGERDGARRSARRQQLAVGAVAPHVRLRCSASAT